MRGNGQQLLDAVQWVTASPSPSWRHARAMAFLYATLGVQAFPGCETLADVAAHLDVPRRTLEAHLAALRAFGFRPPGLRVDNAVRSSEELAHSEEAEDSQP